METKYIKDDKVKYRNQIILTIGDTQVINPTHEMLLENGWVEYITPQPTEEEILKGYKDNLIQEITNYDSSPEVNSFYMGIYPIWLDKATRAGLILRFEAEKSKGLSTTTLWYENNQFPLKVEQGIQMLYAIELYASACYDNTQQHLCNAAKLTTKEEIENYDFKTGYPQKLVFPFEV